MGPAAPARKRSPRPSKEKFVRVSPLPDTEPAPSRERHATPVAEGGTTEGGYKPRHVREETS